MLMISESARLQEGHPHLQVDRPVPVVPDDEPAPVPQLACRHSIDADDHADGAILELPRAHQVLGAQTIACPGPV